jgi:hypothetical protein
MNTLEMRRLEMLTRVRDFGATHAANFPQNSLGSEQFGVVAAVVAELSQVAATQSFGVRSVQQATATRAAARLALRERLQAVSRTARAMALDSPGLETSFRMPRSGSDQALLTAARACVAAARPLADEFIRHELPANFLADLETDIADLERSIGRQNSNRDTHITATATIDSAIERGLSAVQKLDAIVSNKFRDDPAKLAAWESARHTERSSTLTRRANGTPATPPPAS